MMGIMRLSHTVGEPCWGSDCRSWREAACPSFPSIDCVTNLSLMQRNWSLSPSLSQSLKQNLSPSPSLNRCQTSLSLKKT